MIVSKTLGRVDRLNDCVNVPPRLGLVAFEILLEICVAHVAKTAQCLLERRKLPPVTGGGLKFLHELLILLHHVSSKKFLVVFFDQMSFSFGLTPSRHIRPNLAVFDVSCLVDEEYRFGLCLDHVPAYSG